MGAKTALKSTAQKFRLVFRPLDMGTQCTKTWFTPGELVRRIGDNKYRVKVGLGQFREQQESPFCALNPNIREKHLSLD